MPVLVIIIDEYAELAEQAPGAMKHTDTIARLGRAPAVTLVAATQRPTQKVMRQGAVRSQMNIRITFRIQEQRDVDLILGQGKLKDGWQAHKLNAPGKFLVWSPEHDTPRRARAYLVTDDDVRDAVARLRTLPPAPRRHLAPRAHRRAARPSRPTAGPGDQGTGDDPGADQPEDPEDEPESTLRTALSLALDRGSPSPNSSPSPA